MRAVRPSTPKRIFRVAALLAMLACVGPVGSAAAFSKAIWGDVYRNGKSQFPLYHKLGVSIFELGVNWSQVAPTRPAHPANPNDPAYAWPAEVDQAIAQARRYHIRILVQLNNAPRWASGHANPSYAPRHPADFATFAAAAARRWPGVHLWMIWGEPIRTFLPIVPARHGARLNNAQKRAPHRYALLVDKTYRALKAVSRRNLIIAGDSYSTSKLDPYQWISNLRLPNGRAPRMDMYGHNPFTGRDPHFSDPPSPGHAVDFSDLPRLAGWVDHFLRRGMPLFLSEWTVTTAPDHEMSIWVDPPVAGRWVRDALRLSRHWSRIYALGWIHVYDDPPTSNGGLLTVKGKPKPTYWAFLRG
jgi:hypothetical protein